jgi:hypothetical protein
LLCLVEKVQLFGLYSHNLWTVQAHSLDCTATCRAPNRIICPKSSIPLC